MQKISYRLPTEERQSEIIAAVLQLAAKNNPASITTADIASELNLTQGAVFKHFPTKNAMLLAAMSWVESNLLSAMELAARKPDSPIAGLRAAFMAHVKFVMAHPGVPRLIFQDMQQPDDTPLKGSVRGLLARYSKLVVSQLEEAEKQGEIAPGLDKAAAVLLFVGAIQGLVFQSMLAGGADRMAVEAKRVFALYLQGVGART